MLQITLTFIALAAIAYGFIRWELYKSKQRTIPHSIEPVKLRRSRKKKIEVTTEQPDIVKMTREFDKKRKRKAAMSRSSK